MQVKLFYPLALFTLSLLISCGDSDKEEIDCALFDPAFPTLYVELVDETGTNLFENGTINPDSLRVTGDFEGAGFVFNPPNEFAVADADIRKFDNTFQLGIPNQSEFEYTIYFSEKDSIVVNFTAEFTKIPCNVSYYTPIGGIFREKEFVFTKESSLQFLVQLEL